MRRHLSLGGFSLTELLIVILIVGVLASIALPAYQEQMLKARRSEAQQLIVDVVNREEQYLLDARAYTASFATLSYNPGGWTCVTTTSPESCSNAYYSVSIAVDNAATPPTYTITGDSQGSQADDGDLAYASSGSKTRLVSGVDKGW